MEVAKWWIETHQLDYFEKAVKIKEMIKSPFQTSRRDRVSIITKK